MSDLNNSIFQATETIVNAVVENLKFDRSVTAEIVRLNNAEIGEYVVKFEGNEMFAYVNDITVTYNIGDSVYVRIPEGDLSNKKFIERKDEGNKEGVGQLKSSMIQIEDRSPNLIQDIEELSLTLGKEKYETSKKATTVTSSISDTSFKDYASNYTTIQISGIFTTALLGEHSKGNYGIKVNFKTASGDYQVVLDNNNFVGNLYHCEKGVYQSIQVQVLKDYLAGIESIEFFQNGFESDKYQKYDKDSNKMIDVYNEEPALYVKDIQVKFVEIIDYSQTDYYVNIQTSDGTRVSENKDVTLKANLKYRGTDILNQENCSCYWFRQDFTIAPGVEGYNDKAGPGWRLIYPLSYEQNGVTIVEQYSDSITVCASTNDENKKRFEVGSDQEFKLVVVYKNESVFSDTVLIQDLSDPSNYNIIQEIEGATTTLRIEPNTGFGDWYMLSNSGIYEQLDEKVNSIDVSIHLNKAENYFYCAIYKDEEFKCNRTIKIASSSSASGFDVQFEGYKEFIYNSKGDTKYENTELHQWITPVISTKDGTNTSYEMYWTIGGQGLEAKQNPNDSMMQDIYQEKDTNGKAKLHFRIKMKYNNDAINNTPILNLKLANGEIYQYFCPISFTKDGDQATNGTTYSLIVRASDTPMNKFVGAELTNGSLQLKATLYKDGVEDLNKTSGFTWKVIAGDGTLGDTSSNTTTFTSKNNPYNIIKVEYREEGVVDYLSYLFPINTYKNGNAESFDFTLPQFVQYDASGYNPDFLQRKIELPETYTDFSLQDIESKFGITIVSDNNNKPVTIVPKISFNGDIRDKKAYYQLTYNGVTYYFPIVLYLDTTGNEAIEGWDGLSININNSTTDIPDYSKPNKLFAPQVGAGDWGKLKDKTTGEIKQEGFNGVIMGEDAVKGMGLYGYRYGDTAFGLSADGTAFFGADPTKGRIDFDGTTGTITGGGGGHQTYGMTINLSGGVNEKAIWLGANKFYVNYNGFMHAVSGDIGGWSISDEALTSPDGKTILTAGDEDTTSSNITTTAITIKDTDKKVEGDMGAFTTSASTIEKPEYALGLTSKQKIILESENNIRLSGTQLWLQPKATAASDGVFLITDSGHLYTDSFGNSYQLYCNITADKQWGIYARFA